jgi:hypothetical protein
MDFNRIHQKIQKGIVERIHAIIQDERPVIVARAMKMLKLLGADTTAPAPLEVELPPLANDFSSLRIDPVMSVRTEGHCTRAQLTLRNEISCLLLDETILQRT